jgi:ubiquinone/menaquinone biosynthesis C-methylase UbiE
MTTKSQLGEGEFLRRAYAIQSTDEARTLYDEWATSYDADLSAEQYAFPERAATALQQAVGSDLAGLTILDAGCGTGMVGLCLQRLGATHVVGVDISPGMLDVARKSGAYKDTREADLTKRLEFGDAEFYAVICVGTLTRGHVGPDVLDEFVRVVRNDGFVVATILGEIWESHGFRSKVDELAEHKVVVCRSEDVGVVADRNDGGRLIVLRKQYLGNS